MYQRILYRQIDRFVLERLVLACRLLDYRRFVSFVFVSCVLFLTGCSGPGTFFTAQHLPGSDGPGTEGWLTHEWYDCPLLFGNYHKVHDADLDRAASLKEGPLKEERSAKRDAVLKAAALRDAHRKLHKRAEKQATIMRDDTARSDKNNLLKKNQKLFKQADLSGRAGFADMTKEKKNKKLAAIDGSADIKKTPLKKMPIINSKLVGKNVRPASDVNISAAELTLLRKVTDIQHPQSVAFDQKRLLFYVSRLGEKAADKTGAIALLTRDGTLKDASWIKGLGQPRGLAVVGDFLFVADGNRLLKIDIEKAAIVQSFQKQGTFFFNDVVASDDGEVFVSEPLMNVIYKLAGNEFKVWLKDEGLSGPNSLTINKGKMFVGSLGLKRELRASGDLSDASKISDRRLRGNRTSDETIGGLFQIDLLSKKITKLSQQTLPQLSSVASDGEGSVYATTVGRSDLLRFSASTGALLERTDVGRMFKLKETHGLGDFQYFARSKEFWVPVRDKGQILVFVRSDEMLSSDAVEEAR